MPDVSGGLGADIAAERVLVAVDGDAPIGCLIGGMIDGRWRGKYCSLAQPRWEGRRLCLDPVAVAQALRDGADEMALARHRDMHRNVALYERLGWRVSGEHGNRIMMHRDTAA